ncbi:rod shape-determining protein RodA [Flagellimonas taeanensis]|uniref:Rod shape determining protein RodA n=1 Tax=Flagellimonas taeanensis TaxID=1005926 RepID=A0A1M6P993_9FLAO|nr:MULTISPECIES: rod shape-determining protein RodA [Allomuricauda]MDC6385002.1 rod shape-determining protein RodA [Muricauda sp. SK9]MEE1961157.1 rod shape-determining protein RodA [Allomuricauda taeanensis]RIV49027.1 rod shape-determining protein RodA [Allomuricauda taeanensis]SFB66447.1 rod shape determining protein RodA [Allomuricauda taeanensis]SHK04506.1 rod shape determining protein RodA [Allomuricauda taeanensis]
MSGKGPFGRIDWISVFLYLLLVFIGWINIYSTSLTDADSSIFDFSTLYGKQLFFFGLAILGIILVLFVESSFFERFASIFYMVSIVLLLGLFVFGKTIAGATSWYDLGFFNLQPSELAKMTTALALAKFLSDIQTDIKTKKHQMYALVIILLPALLILPQPDPGSALIYFSLFFVLFREGFPLYYLGILLVMVILFATTLMFGTVWVTIGLIILALLIYTFKKASVKIPVLPVVGVIIVSVLFSLSVKLVYDHVFEQRHRDRFALWLSLEKDEKKLEEIRKTIGYNTYQSEKAIESGGFFGKGFLEGTRTKGDFVPEQHTDYIFSSVGEEWGFLGTVTVILLFSIFFLRLIHLAERQKSDFSRMYGYGVISILVFHYFINIGMVIGLLPTIGVPLPFFSYGGSGLIFFSMLLFIFLKLDSNRLKDGI